MHDGLQSDGYLELRLDWKAVSRAKNEDSVAKVALIRVNPWLAYGCGEGARLAVRKPGATEGIASTLQRALRDDYVVVRRDGTYRPSMHARAHYGARAPARSQRSSQRSSLEGLRMHARAHHGAPRLPTGTDSELTVDPTPFTVVTATNPRHQPGTRLLIVHENSCVDAVVEPWPEAEIPIHMGSRHQMRVEGKHISGWITIVSKDQKQVRPIAS